MSKARAIIIAVASGKGGTGKTTLAAHLALVCSKKHSTLLVDLDVEAPDIRGYFPSASSIEDPLPVMVTIPYFNSQACIGCGACSQVCHFGAIVSLGRAVTVGKNLCKGCGRCIFSCPAGALTETEIPVGITSLFKTGAMEILEGRLNIGDIRTTAVIEEAKRRALGRTMGIQIRDCPPGVSCPATHGIEGADYVILVAEPTEFSRHDLKAALTLVADHPEKAGVVINKAGSGKADIEGICKEFAVPIISHIAFTRQRAALGATAGLWDQDGLLMEEMGAILSTALGATQQSEGNYNSPGHEGSS